MSPVETNVCGFFCASVCFVSDCLLLHQTVEVLLVQLTDLFHVEGRLATVFRCSACRSMCCCFGLVLSSRACGPNLAGFKLRNLSALLEPCACREEVRLRNDCCDSKTGSASWNLILRIRPEPNLLTDILCLMTDALRIAHQSCPRPRFVLVTSPISVSIMVILCRVDTATAVALPSPVVSSVSKRILTRQKIRIKIA